MHRTAMKKLFDWKAGPRRRPLFIEGARGVGKTWLMEAFGKEAYADMICIDFESNARMAELFAPDLDTGRLVAGIELYAGRKLDPDHTLLIFDEIEEVPRALASLKYFAENAPQYHIVCASSFSCTALPEGTSFPVGKVDFLRLHPLTFHEFLCATGEGRFAELLEKQDFGMAACFQESYRDALKHYCFVGGMPEAVKRFAEKKDFNEVRAVQKRILAAFEVDRSRHAPPAEIPKIRRLWESIPSQLAREKKKFVYGLLRKGARAKDYERALLWLSDCGLVHRVNRVERPGIPLKAFEDPRAFKLFVLDVGLLGAMAEVNPKILLDGNDLFTAFSGALTQQYVCQQLKALTGWGVCCYANERGSAEVDFVLNTGELVVPLEARAKLNPKAKSLKPIGRSFRLPCRSGLPWRATGRKTGSSICRFMRWDKSPESCTHER